MPEPIRYMHMDHGAHFRQLCPPWRTKYTVSGDVLFVGFSHYSLDVPCDLVNFVDYLKFHLCMSACDDVYQGLDHLASPLVHYLTCP